MIIYPAIDLIDGDIVRLHKGDFDQKTTYGSNPVEVACAFRGAGAEWLHLVDLDGAKNPHNRQINLITEIISKSGLKVQTGGGIRSREDIVKLIGAGASRIVLGSLAVREPNLVQEFFDEFGPERICLAADVIGGDPENSKECYHIAFSGWQAASGITLSDFLTEYQGAGLQHVLCTDVARDGTMSGCNNALYVSIKEMFPSIQLQASGGVRSLDDVASLNTDGVIIGKAIYEGIFSVNEALAIGKHKTIDGRDVIKC